jgi:hypothetical protein
VLFEAGHDLDEVARLMPGIELQLQDSIPGIAASAG